MFTKETKCARQQMFIKYSTKKQNTYLWVMTVMNLGIGEKLITPTTQPSQ